MAKQSTHRRTWNNGLVLLLLLPAAAGAAPPTTQPARPKFTLAKDTTYILGPLKDDGTPDYVAALNAELAKGVTPENNAFVLVLQAVGPGVLGEADPAKVYRLLGIQPLPAEGDYLVGSDEYLARLAGGGKPNEKESDAFRDAIFKAASAPWAEKDRPRIAAWLKLNERPLALLAEASKRPQWYRPRVAPKAEAETILNAEVSGISQRWIFDAGHCLAPRAMLKMSGNDPLGAWTDLLTVARLGRLLMQEPSVLSQMLGRLMTGRSAASGSRLLTNGRLTGRQIRGMLADLEALPGSDSETVLRTMRYERLYALSEAMAFMMGDSADSVEPALLSSLQQINLDPILRQFNAYYDALEAAAKKPTRREHREAVKTARQELARRAGGMAQNPGAMLDQLFIDLQAREKLGAAPDLAQIQKLAEDLTPVGISYISSDVEQYLRALDRTSAEWHLFLLQVALAACKAEKGGYPQALAELTPDYLKAIPDDPFTDKPPIYRRTDDAYLLYSVGPNMKDDAGIDDRQADKDDIAVRVPAEKPAGGGP